MHVINWQRHRHCRYIVTALSCYFSPLTLIPLNAHDASFRSRLCCSVYRREAITLVPSWSNSSRLKFKIFFIRFGRHKYYYDDKSARRVTSKTVLHCTAPTHKWGGCADAHPNSVNETVKIMPNDHECEGGMAKTD